MRTTSQPASTLNLNQAETGTSTRDHALSPSQGHDLGVERGNSGYVDPLTPGLKQMSDKAKWDLLMDELLHSGAPVSYSAYQALAASFSQISSLSNEAELSSNAYLARTQSSLTTMVMTIFDFIKYGNSLDNECQKLITDILVIIGNNDTVVFNEAIVQRCLEVQLKIEEEISKLQELVKNSHTNKATTYDNIIAVASHRLTRCSSIAGLLLTGSMTIYASIGDVSTSPVYKIAGVLVSILQGMIIRGGPGLSLWMNKVTCAFEDLRKHSHILLSAWSQFSQLLRDISAATPVLPSMLRVKSFLESFQASFLTGRFELVEIGLQQHLPPDFYRSTELGTDVEPAEQKVIVATKWDSFHAAHVSSSTPHDDGVVSAEASQSWTGSPQMTELAFSHSLRAAPGNLPLLARLQTNVPDDVSLPADSERVSPKLCDSPVSVCTSSGAGNSDNEVNAVFAECSVTKAVSRPSTIITSFQANPVDTPGRTESGHPTRPNKITRSYTGYASSPTQGNGSNSSVSPHATTSLSSGCRVGALSKRDAVQEQQPAGQGTTFVDRRRSVFHSKDDNDDVEPLASSTTVSSSEIMTVISVDSGRSELEHESSIPLRKVKTA